MHGKSRTVGLGLALIGAMLALAAPLTAKAAEPLCPKASAAALAPSPPTLPGAESYVFKTVGDRQLRVYVFKPKGKVTGRRPALVFYFGGGWMFGSVTRLAPIAQHFAERGDVTMLVDYRVYCRDGVNIVDEVKDAKAGLSWIRAHARQLHVAPDHIAAVGGSSGGHMALSTAMFEDLDEGGRKGVSSRPDLLVLFFPCTDPTTAIEMQYSAKAIQTYGAQVSPALHIRPGLPPMLVAQGTADPLYEENKAYCAKVAAAGGSCQLVEFKDAPHGFFLPGGKWYDDGLRTMDDYLTRNGYLTAE